MEERADKGLAFMLQYENVAWYENGEVRILDRRVYPRKVEFVICKTHQEVAQALTDMVTQSTGPFTAALIDQQAVARLAETAIHKTEGTCVTQQLDNFALRLLFKPRHGRRHRDTHRHVGTLCLVIQRFEGGTATTEQQHGGQ